MSTRPIPTPVRDDELGVLPVMRVWYGDCELWADCGNCGAKIGPQLRPNDSLDVLSAPWERHAMTACVA